MANSTRYSAGTRFMLMIYNEQVQVQNQVQDQEQVKVQEQVHVQV